MFNEFLHDYDNYVAEQEGKQPQKTSHQARAEHLQELIRTTADFPIRYVLQGEHLPNLADLDREDLNSLEQHLSGAHPLPFYKLQEILVNKPNAKLFEKLENMPSPVVG